MLGAMIGDIVGSRFEWSNIKTKDFEFFADNCFFTDDTVMTAAVAKAILDCDDGFQNIEKYAEKEMRYYGKRYPDSGYGGRFQNWLTCSDPKPYFSFGNGAAMRISPTAYLYNSMEDSEALSDRITGVTHNHPEGLKGARAVTDAIFMARKGFSKNEIRNRIEESYYSLDFMIDDIRSCYMFDVTCQGSVPQAIKAFLESVDFEDSIRIAISIGGDSDTIAAITGSISEAFYTIPENIKKKAESYLDKEILSIVNSFYVKYMK